MKLNFKEWNLVYEALAGKAREIASNLKWHEDWAKEHEVEEEGGDIKELRAQLASYTSIIKKLETSML